MDDQNRNIKEGKQPVPDDVSDEQNRDDQNNEDQNNDDQKSDDQKRDDQNSDEQNSDYQNEISEEGEGLHRRKRRWDVFINHHSTKKTLAGAIYDTLKSIGIHAFLEVEEEQKRGGSIPAEVIVEAISTARLHIAIFSKKYAKSPKCLVELSIMLQSGIGIIPVYYHVELSDLQGAAQGKGCYAPAFSQYEKKGGYSYELEEWKKALQRVSSFSGHTLYQNYDDEWMLLGSIVNSVGAMLEEPDAVTTMEFVKNSFFLTNNEGMHLKSKENSVQEHEFRFVDRAAAFNSAALMLVLGSYGLVLSNLLFWMCWTILVIKVVIYNSYESEEESRGTTRPHFAGANILKVVTTEGANILKVVTSFVLFILLLWKEDITKRQNIMLFIIVASIILFEGITLILRRKKELSLKRNQKSKDLIFFIPSALNAMMSMTGLIIMGGDLGRLMSKKAICGFTFIFLVDALAEVIPRVVNGMRFPFMSEDFAVPKTHHVVFMLRMIVEGCLCGWMGKVIYQVSYFPSSLGTGECNKLCRERSKHILITMVALEGLQVIETFNTYFLCHLLAHRHHHHPLLPRYNVSP